MCHGSATDGAWEGSGAAAAGPRDHHGGDECARGQPSVLGGSGGAARRRGAVAWRLCAAVTLVLVLPRAGAADTAFFDGGDPLKIYQSASAGGQLSGAMCDAETPPDGFVLPVKCTQTSLPNDPLALSCLPVAFSVVTNQTLAKQPTGQDFMLPPVSSAGDVSKFDTEGCELPGSSLIDQICGQNFLQQACGLQTMSTKRLVRTYGRCAVPMCPKGEEGGPCVCGDAEDVQSPVGSCECFHWQRYSLKPNRFMPVQDSKTCFQAPLRGGDPENPEYEVRCVYLDITVAPSTLVVRHGGDIVTQVNATVGQPLKLTVMAEDLNTHQTLAIGLQPSVTSEKPSVELPRQRWLTEGSRCVSRPDLAQASMRERCQATVTRAVWRRELSYTPVLSESGMAYSVNFQATDSGVSQGALVGTVENYKFRSSLKGTACGPDMASVCPTSSLTFAPMTSSIRVYVQQVVPVFESAVGAQGFQGTPPAGALPHAYPNCPMPAVPIYVWKANAELELSLSFGRSSDDEAAGLAYVSPAPFGFTSHSTCSQDAKDQHRYRCPRYTSPRSTYSSVSLLHGMTLEWTPPLEAAGSVYKVCVTAQDDAPSHSTRCWTIAVQRCMYCTDSESVSHLATRFRTNWLQIWSSNDPEWVALHAHSLESSKVKAWEATDYPHQLEQGTLVRLGPVYHTRAEHSFDELAQRFGTTVHALIEMNPDIAHLAEDKAPIPMNQEMCVLPGICTAAPGMTIDA